MRRGPSGNRFTKAPPPRVPPRLPQDDSPNRRPPARPPRRAHGDRAPPDDGSAWRPPPPTKAVALFRALRASPEEARAIDAVSARRVVSRDPRVAPRRGRGGARRAGRAGEGARARVVSGAHRASSPEARLLAADLHADRGEIAEALATIERVLVLDLDYPGARERHARWRTALGLDASAGERAPTRTRPRWCRASRTRRSSSSARSRAAARGPSTRRRIASSGDGSR